MKPIYSNGAKASQTPSRDQIAVAAFHLYVERGGQDGHDLDDWLKAERMLSQQLGAKVVGELLPKNQSTTKSPASPQRTAPTYAHA